MRLELSPEVAEFRAGLREFFTTKVPQDVRDTVRAGGHLSKDQIIASHRTLNDAGLAAPHWPEEWGGRGWTQLQTHLWNDEMQRACVPPPLAFNTSMVGPVIAAFGSQAQKERFLPDTAALKIWWCQGFSEPEAGSDLASLRTTAVRDGDEWVVNGQKTWTTLGQYADWIFCLVRTNPDAPRKQAGISFLVFRMDSPGVTLRPIKLIDGGFEVNEVFFDNVRVPADQLIGEENAGWSYAKFLLGNERVGVAPVTATKVWLAHAKEYAAQPLADGTRLIDQPAVASRIALLENQLAALELTVLRVAGNSAEGKPDPASSILKLRGTQLQQEASELLVDLAGPDGLVGGDGVDGIEPWAQVAVPRYLNYRKASIYGGSNEVQRSIIASSILGL
ncbi:acyl-CoA dehydrogenase, middle domain protein [Aeromicrobium marinum DSM 15272]|uniref:Acyl-CoA dehydrogenase, middle domain protein n=1 Tax=Aeromicrobium marinum DSM 15272 TaxID=585531 RepID=E2S8D4_9ACTN|nr:acyl-CoA dehydrogenase family protein [Aeromicrobium marinum]EFQ84439.1 acyl-CoA dehydrogenase, middle domain protein [Aeromicrobium marinum DSM 15272]